MPTLFFEGNFFGEDTEVEVPEGGALVDICDRVSAPVPFSCRSATCGTCRIEVSQGLQHFEPRNEVEAELLDVLADPPHFRLACQAKLKAEAGVVRLRIADDEL
ncbi:MAG TPA: 2Fe-2S iron-sulfur cluster-binding protein [Polyangiaceae bacterium]|nr:2Fe-2S iron-sulfur cluster-binding protein [Polyangiaceae bacterium]